MMPTFKEGFARSLRKEQQQPSNGKEVSEPEGNRRKTRRLRIIKRNFEQEQENPARKKLWL
jgi:hypothetical protein